MFVDPMLRGISRTNVPAFRLDPRPQPGSPALTSALSAPNDGFYNPVAYKGAFKDVNWASDWGFAAEVCLITGEGAGTPRTTRGRTPPNLAIAMAGGNVTITFTGVAGASYQVQSTTDLGGHPIVWTPEGAPLSGTGTLSYSTPVSGGSKFFRVVSQ
jgi:hypothetical protein